MQDDTQPETPKTEAPEEQEPVIEAVDTPSKPEAEPEANPEPDQPPVGPAKEEATPTLTLAEEMTAMTNAAKAPVPQKNLKSLPFPWFRTALIGLFLPLVTVALAVGVYFIIQQMGMLDSLKSYWWAFWVVLGVCGIVVALPAARMLHAMQVGRSLFLALGTVACSLGIVALLSTLYADSFGSAWGWQSTLATWPSWMLYSLPFTGMVVIIFLTLIINSLGRYIPKFLTALLFVVIVAAPWVGNYFAA